MGSVVFGSARVWAVGGSRSLPEGGEALLGEGVRALVASGAGVVVGCASGADAVALAACRPVRVFAAFGPGGAGACRWSAVGRVALASGAGVPVSWWAGGGPEVPLPGRLASRTRAVVRAASEGLLLFPVSGSSRGSWLAAREASVRGLRVVVCPLGRFVPPELGAGQWAPVPWPLPGCFEWQASPGLF